jgi:succinate dehydrogenase/fumarate reductase flavoprotein subunit
MSRPFDLGSMNASYGENWTEHWCDTCYRNKWKCRIFMMAISCEQQPELIYNEDGDTICTKYKNKADHIVKHRPNKEQMEIEL